MAKVNPLTAGRLGPYATITIDGVAYRELRPTTSGSELEAVGPGREKLFLSHKDLRRGEEERSIVVTRSNREHPSLQSLSLKARRDIFIKTWWLTRVAAALRSRELAGTGDVELGKFMSKRMDDIRKAVEIWEKDAGYDHSVDRRRKQRKPNVGSERVVAEPVLTPRSIRGLLPKFLQHNESPFSVRKPIERCRSGGKRLDDRVLEIVREEVAKYAGEANPNVAGLHRLVAAKIVIENKDLPPELRMSIPAWGTLNRVKDDMPEGRKIGARKGPRAVNNALGPFGEGPVYYRAGERSEMDCWNIPIFVLLKKAKVIGEVPKNIADALVEHASRIHLAAVVDKSSGYFTGMRFGLSESAELTTAALKMSLVDKTRYSNWAGCEQKWNLFTGTEELTTDAGPGFYADRFVSAAIPATSSHVYAASGLPHLRGLIESVFSTLHKGFIAKMIARAFENVVSKGDYKPAERAVLTLEEFLILLVRYVVDVYHNMPRNGGLRASPHREFLANAASMETKAPATPDEIRVWFGFEATRKLGPMGIRFMHIHYDSDWLVKYRNHYGLATVQIRVDEDDIGTISVLLGDDWLPVPARDTEFQGIALDDWTNLIADLRLRFGAQAEIDFERYVAPALIEIERANRAAEKRLELQEVFWSEERFNAFEDTNRINFVNRKRPEAGKPAPSFGDGTIGRRFERTTTTVSQPVVPATPDAVDSPPNVPPSNNAPRRRRLKYRDDK